MIARSRVSSEQEEGEGHVYTYIVSSRPRPPLGVLVAPHSGELYARRVPTARGADGQDPKGPTHSAASAAKDRTGTAYLRWIGSNLCTESGAVADQCGETRDDVDIVSARKEQ